MRTRKADYFDEQTYKPVYSFQVKYNGVWHNAHASGKPCLYDTEAERDIERKKVSKIKHP